MRVQSQHVNCNKYAYASECAHVPEKKNDTRDFKINSTHHVSYFYLDMHDIIVCGACKTNCMCHTIIFCFNIFIQYTWNEIKSSSALKQMISK